MARPAASHFPSLLAACVALVVLTASRGAHAFAWMIRHDYAQCATCHVDPSGGGMLTAYGRAQSEVLLRTRYGVVPEDEDPLKLASFAFGAVPLPESIQLQVDARVAGLRVQPPSPAPAVTRLILMQSDVAGQWSVGRARLAATLGYVHEGALGASVSHGDHDRLVSRQHWVAFAATEDESVLIRIGRMNLPFGLRMIEHTAFARDFTKTDINAAQSHGVAVAYNVEKWRAEAMAIAGNLQLSPAEYRERGYAAYVEYAPIQSLAVGVSSLVVHAERDLTLKRAAFRQAHGLFVRYTPARPVVISAEADMLASSPIRKSIEVGHAALLQVDVEPLRGVHAIVMAELARQPAADTPGRSRGWASVAWFCLPHLDVRADFIRDFTSNGAFTMLGQIHGFL